MHATAAQGVGERVGLYDGHDARVIHTATDTVTTSTDDPGEASRAGGEPWMGSVSGALPHLVCA